MKVHKYLIHDWVEGASNNFLSHIKLLLEASESTEPVIILEDDVMMHAAFSAYVEELLTKHRNFDLIALGFNWDAYVFASPQSHPSATVQMCFFQRDLLSNWGYLQNAVLEPTLWKASMYWGSCAYIVSPQGARKMLDSFQNVNPGLFTRKDLEKTFRINSKDAAVNTFLTRLEAFVCVPPIAWAKNLKSESKIWKE